MKPRERLRIAAQKSGRLAEPSQDLLARCGLKFRQSRDKLFCFGETLPIDLLLVRDDDIPGMIAEGVCDLGVVGSNVLEEQRLAAIAVHREPGFRALRTLGFGQCRLTLAIPHEQEWSGARQLQDLRIATTYPALLEHWLGAQGVRARVVTLSGSVEIAPRLGTADLICDLLYTAAQALDYRRDTLNAARECDAGWRLSAGSAASVRDARPDSPRAAARH
ncbi:ATP phosphoribosyltransferase [Metallibacterium scheffleri]|uniref:ATP phosphoribosyltransferase n=1 Tax=Metallibacterium scheffleri TaxID=993689 RepID=A0A4S3KDG6_9GAMM|nr:ATP phosphoribosyltransferase [Metallibacterium scheffleri]